MAPWTASTSASNLSTRASLPQAVSLWSQQYQSRYNAIIDSIGDFNGTCTKTEESIPLLLDNNMCASWFLDITVFCCGAVGGDLQQASRASTSVENTTASNDESTFEPVCVTSNYRDMLDCYKITSVDSCSSADVAPWGICNPQLADTSRTSSGASSSNPATRNSSHHAVLLLVLFLPILTAMIW